MTKFGRRENGSIPERGIDMILKPFVVPILMLLGAIGLLVWIMLDPTFVAHR